jgi:hypothetical protein
MPINQCTGWQRLYRYAQSHKEGENPHAIQYLEYKDVDGIPIAN